MSKEQVRCLDCRHRKVTFVDLFANTARFRGVCLKAWIPEQRKFDPVLGEEVVKGHYENPAMARVTVCGKEGQLWEPKNKTDLFKYIKHVSSN